MRSHENQHLVGQPNKPPSSLGRVFWPVSITRIPGLNTYHYHVKLTEWDSLNTTDNKNVHSLSAWPLLTAAHKNCKSTCHQWFSCPNLLDDILAFWSNLFFLWHRCQKVIKLCPLESPTAQVCFHWLFVVWKIAVDQGIYFVRKNVFALIIC